MKYYVNRHGAYIVTLPPEETAHISYLGRESIGAYWQWGKGTDWLYLPVSLTLLQTIAEVTYEQFVKDVNAAPLRHQFEKMLNQEESFSLPELKQICASYRTDKEAYEGQLNS